MCLSTLREAQPHGELIVMLYRVRLYYIIICMYVDDYVSGYKWIEIDRNINLYDRLLSLQAGYYVSIDRGVYNQFLNFCMFFS